MQKIFSAPYQNVPSHIIQMNNSDYVFNNTIFIASSLTELPTDLIRIDTSMNLLWSKRYITSVNRLHISRFIEVAPDTLIAIAGVYNANNDFYGYVLLKIDGNGNTIMVKKLINTDSFYFSGLEWSNEQQMLVIYGKYIETSFYDERMQILTYDKDLNFLWGKQYRYGFMDEIKSAKFYGNNGLVLLADVIGNVDSNSTEPCCNVLLVRIDNSGGVMWVKRIGNIPNLFSGGNHISSGEIMVLDDGKMINAIETNYFGGFFFSDIIIQKTDSIGNELNSIQIGNNSTQWEYFSQLFKNINSQIFVRYRTTSNMILDVNLNYIDYKRTIPNTGFFGTAHQIPLKAGGTVILGSRTDISKIEIIQTDSLANIGCYQLPNISFPYQQVSFANSIPMQALRDSVIIITDSILNVTTISVAYTDSMICTTSMGIEYANIDNLKIYPTVFTEEVNIQNAIGNSINIELLDISGKIIISQVILKNHINLSFLQKGVYFLKVNTRFQSKTFKIIKQ